MGLGSIARISLRLSSSALEIPVAPITTPLSPPTTHYRSAGGLRSTYFFVFLFSFGNARSSVSYCWRARCYEIGSCAYSFEKQEFSSSRYPPWVANSAVILEDGG